MSGDNKPIIVIKKKGGHGGHHGGAWKVAYADFVTAMMAFFMVMWLVNSADTQTKKSIASYFRRPGLFEHGSGTPLLMGEAGILADAYAPTQKKKQEQYTSGEMQQVLKKKTGSEDAKKDKKITKSKGANADKLVMKGDTKSKRGEAGQPKEQEGSQGGEATKDVNLPQTEEDQKKLVLMFQENEQKQHLSSQDKKMEFPPGGPRAPDKAELERQMLESVKEQLEQEMIKSPELKELLGMVEVKLEADGLKIEIMDTNTSSMFSLGSARILPEAQVAFQKIGTVLSKLPNRVDIVGHTDGKPFSARAGGYSNWELSADRANAARRLLEQQGIDISRVSGVVGRADQELRTPANPLDPSNRRITLKVRFLNPPPIEVVRDVNEIENNPRLKAPPPQPVAAPPRTVEPPVAIEPPAVENPPAESPPAVSPEGEPLTPEPSPTGDGKAPTGFKPKKLIQATQRAKKKISVGEEGDEAAEGAEAGAEAPAAPAGDAPKKPFGDHPVIGPRGVLLGF